MVQSKSGNCKNILCFNSVTVDNTRLNEERKQETKCVWISGKYFYMIASFVHIICLQNFVVENLKSLILIFALLPFFFEKCQSLFPQRKGEFLAQSGEVCCSFSPVDKTIILLKLWICLLKQGEKERWQKPAAGFF